ncbi:hypothetical protein JOD31_000105 [Methylopila capsulata]|uniref:Uncharacterized protein n=1 Tax=Methylopila capsulata TaxID=61654 RepID=A0A9W6MRE3_9HYPH|nr:Imm21 family immunity protein [Methylopila capsulata]MBM7849893.1 hypothetical protein [Methylopila capsulata]GLK55183.1 hypothetical protein GCM10008170_12020 [Methylopila capsulata]
MDDVFRWIWTLGGPHLVAPREWVAACGGDRGWRENAPDDPSDYARACRSLNYTSVEPNGGGVLAVLSGVAGAVTLIPCGHGEGVIVQWVGCDSEALVQEAIAAPRPFADRCEGEAEEIDFATGPSGDLVIFDSVEIGDEPFGSGSRSPCGRGRTGSGPARSSRRDACSSLGC